MVDKGLFSIDLKGLDEFDLPKRQIASTIVMPPKEDRNSASKTKATLRKVKQFEARESAGATKEKEKDFSFVATAMGTTKLSATAPAALQDPSSEERKDETGKPVYEKSPTQSTKAVDNDEVAAIMAGIKTSNDAINFFARYGSETPVKFVTLIQNPDPRVYSPYELVVTDISEADTPADGYYTMSSSGIVHICKGEPSECTPLSTFMRQGMIFKILRNIPFYKLYLHRKAFTIWKENIRYLLFTKQRKKLVDRLFFARKNSCQAIINSRKCLVKIKEVRILNTRDLKTSTKESFFEMQSNFINKANQEFEAAMSNMANEVQTLISEVNNLYATTRQDHNANALSFSDAAVEKAKSLVKMKQEKAEKKLLRQRAKLEHGTLPEFIRCIDYLSVEFLVAMALNVSVGFNEELGRSRKNGIFETQVKFGTMGTSFSPTAYDLREMIENLMDTMINQCGNVGRIIYLTKGAVANGPNIQTIIRESKTFNSVMNDIRQRINSDFYGAEEHARTYEALRPFFEEFIVTWDFENFKLRQHDSASLKGIMERIEDWNKELLKLRNKNIGLLELDSKRLQNDMTLTKESRLAELKDYIKELARYVIYCLS